MDFNTLKDDFLRMHPDYANDIANFLEYTQTVKGYTPDREDMMVKWIKTEDVINSLYYHIEQGRIRKQEPAKKYFVAVGQLFEYVLNNSEYQNSDFLHELANPKNRKRSYKGRTSKFVNECDMLKPKESFQVIDQSMLDRLVGWCDSVLSKLNEIKEEYIDETDFKRIAAALCMKLIVLSGITYREARKLRVTNLDVRTCTIEINGFSVRLPMNLSKQFQDYIKYHIKHINSEFLFSGKNGNQWGPKTSDSGIPNFMKTAVQQTDLTGIIKYGITQLIICGINDSVIMKLTGASQEVLSNCLDEVQGNDMEWNKYLNSKIVATDYYYRL